MQAGIDIGPCVDQGQMETVLRYIEIGRKESGEPLCGGRRLTDGALAKGYFVEPTVFADVAEDHTIAREEIFGPVLAIMRARDFEDAMRIANDIPFGLSSSIQTGNLSRAFEYIYRAEAGLLTVNLPSAGRGIPACRSAAPRTPASGRKSRARRRWNFIATTRRCI